MWTNSTIVGRKSGLQASNQGGEDKSFFFHQKLTVRLHTILVFLHIIFVFVYVFFLPWTLDNVCLLVGYYSNIDCTGNPSIRVFFVFLFFVCICLYLFVFVCICLYFCILVFLAMTFLRCDGTRMDNNHVSVCDDTGEMRTNYRKD